ncbi:MAG: hypothetical protein Q9177_004983 [Variospora cf. flavescens]
MPLDDYEDKWACDPCVRGHRASRCNHFERLMGRVKRPGRPLTTCPHASSSCNCQNEKVLMVEVTNGRSENGQCRCMRLDKHRKMQREAAAAAAAQAYNPPPEIDFANFQHPAWNPDLINRNYAAPQNPPNAYPTTYPPTTDQPNPYPPTYATAFPPTYPPTTYPSTYPSTLSSAGPSAGPSTGPSTGTSTGPSRIPPPSDLPWDDPILDFGQPQQMSYDQSQQLPYGQPPQMSYDQPQQMPYGQPQQMSYDQPQQMPYDQPNSGLQQQPLQPEEIEGAPVGAEGGSLSRSRKQNANLNIIQKKHFARARAKLLNGHSSPFRLGLSIFHDEENPCASHLEEHPPTQLTLEEYEVFKPVVKQLQSLKPRYAMSNMPSRVTESRRPSPSFDDDSVLAPQLKYRASNVFVKGQNYKEKATASEANPTKIAPVVDELEAKRRELLGTSDWIGLKKIKPLQMRFPDAEDRDLIGKRRRVDNDPYQADSAPNLYRKPVVNSYEKQGILRTRSKLLSSPSKISIHIGSSGRGSPARPREKNGSRGVVDHQACVSDEMLFNDQESVRTSMCNQPSAQNSCRHYANTSEEMLFDREWSGISTSTNRSSYQGNPPFRPQPMRADKGSLAHSVSSRADSEYLNDPGYAADEHDHQDKLNLLSPYALPGSIVPCVTTEPLTTIGSENRRPDGDDNLANPQHAEGLRSPDRGQAEGIREQPPPQNEERPPCSAQGGKHSPRQRFVARQDSKDEKQPSTQATVRDIVPHLHPAGSLQSSSYHVKHGRISKASPPNLERDDMKRDKFQISAREQQHWDELFRRQDDPMTILKETKPNDRAATSTAGEALPRAPSPPPTPTIPSHEHVEALEPPADPTPEEDEIIWRTFVFGTANPNGEDWIFDNPSQGRDAPRQSHRPNNSSSSPLHTLPQTASASASSPKTQTQPSLLAEASSSTSSSSSTPAPTLSSSSLARPQPLPSTIADFPPTSSVPTSQPSTSPANRTQHSVQAQAHTSSDELALCPTARMRPPPRPVVFRRPRRYEGEELSCPVSPLRLGVTGPGAKGKERGKGAPNEEEYAEGRRKRKRGDYWRGKVQAAMEEDNEDEERDEIVDD